MAEKTKKQSPPYASFSGLLTFLNKLRETVIPNRIDASMFGNASGTHSYSIIAALKFLDLIDDSNATTPKLIEIVNAAEDDRKRLIAEVIRNGYPTLFTGDVDLTTITAGQFDEHVRNVFDVQGSTVDKIAAFFIAAAKYTYIEISPHLKARKPIAASSGSRKSAKQRKQDNGGAASKTGDAHLPPPPPAPTKPLQYQLIDLMQEPDINDDVKDSIWNLVQYLMERAKNKTTATQTDESPS